MSSSTPSPPVASESVVSRLQSFVQENKKAVLIGAGLAVVLTAGGVWFIYSLGNAMRDDLESGNHDGNVKRKKDKKEKKGKKKDKLKDGGPILEEKKDPKEVVLGDEPRLSTAEIEALSLEDRLTRATTLKVKGNEAYQKKEFPVAIEYYTRAIAMTPKPEAVYYSNRAACYIQMKPPNYEVAVADCDEALKLDKNYVKALNRRANALENLGRYRQALRDFTAVTILEKFQNTSSAMAVERVLRLLAVEEAAEILRNRETRLPSTSFMSAYFAAFRSRALPTLPESPTTADQQLVRAFEALAAFDYAHAFTLVNESLEGDGPSWDVGKAEAYNLRGTFLFLCTDTPQAQKDLLKSTEIVPAFTQSWVKLASVYMEQQETTAAFEAFETAIKHNKNDPDIYYHRGQVYFIMNEWAKAMEDYVISVSLDDKFVFSHIQLAVAQYKSGDIAKSLATFRRTLKAFPNRSEPANYYGELLLDQTRFKDAIDKFDLAIDLEKKKTRNVNVLPMVNKGLALFQSSQDANAATKLCEEALSIDTENEAAVATLAQLNLQQGKIKEAVKMFDKHCHLTRTEPELMNALTYKYASEAQLEFLESYPHMAAQMGQLAQNIAP